VGESVRFLRYDAAKASIDETTTTKHQHRVSARAGSIVNELPLCESNCWTSSQTMPRSDVADALVNMIRITE